MLTFLPLEQIDEMAKWEGEQLNKAKEILAYELTNMVHGEEEAKKAQEAARAIFAAAQTVHICRQLNFRRGFHEKEKSTISLLVKAELAKTFRRTPCH